MIKQYLDQINLYIKLLEQSNAHTTVIYKALVQDLHDNPDLTDRGFLYCLKKIHFELSLEIDRLGIDVR